MDVITSTNDKLLGALKSPNMFNTIGWILAILLLIGGLVWLYFYYMNKKQYNKKITAFEIVGNNFVPAFSDQAKVVKIGTGGFEILYLKKLKTWKIAYGGRVGKDTYYFFIWKDGYWYNSMLSADMNAIDKNGGLIPIVTTNPSMRAQYTSLEKQIDALHSEKKSFMDKYGSWVWSLGFIIVIGVLAWLIYKEIGPVTGNLATAADKLGMAIDKLNVCSQPVSTNTGLIPVR